MYIYVLAEKETLLKSMGERWLMKYIRDGQSVYFTADGAEEGRQAGDAYDEPGKTRVVGFEMKPFLPPKKRQ